MKMHKTFLLALACLWSLGASAQWQWIDKDGRKVFSDRPPPADVPEKNVLKKPSGGFVRDAAPAASAPSGDAAASAPQATKSADATAAPAGKDKALEKKKAEAEAAEAAKKKQEEEKMAKTKAENCARARQAKELLASGRPLSHVNTQGERGFMNEDQRAAENKRAQSVIDSDCKR